MAGAAKSQEKAALSLEELSMLVFVVHSLLQVVFTLIIPELASAAIRHAKHVQGTSIPSVPLALRSKE